MKVLLADDEKSIRLTLGDDLEAAGHDVKAAADGREATALLDQERFDVLITDIKMPGVTGIELLSKAKETAPDIEVILITGFGTIESAVEAMKLGAYDYILKPFLNEKIVALLEKIERLKRLTEENVRLREELIGRYRFDKLVGKSKKMQEIFGLIDTLRDNDCSILIQGETGTGKELITHAIHHSSRRKGGPLVVLSCSQFPETLLEDELFGHEKGAFTDARERKVGRFESAQGGTLFLDDIDDMTLPTQVKLLRILQERKFERLGGSDTIALDIRVISATKVDLEEAVAQGSFREDLYYRLNVVKLLLPPVRERTEDIPLLAEHFIRIHGGGREFEIPPATLEAMLNYPWPGNVRELENSIERATALAGRSRILKREHLIRQGSTPSKVVAQLKDLRPLRDVVSEAEMLHIKNVLKHTQGQKAKAAEILDISRKNLWEKMREYGVE
ncbi:MAG: sigma-54 dependent transcriptional regulator [Planctomycetes bacterium]|nr:sigma-54 dependent transcriptional regulator [Planctomycetota bacterium]